MQQPKRCILKEKFQAQSTLPEDLLVEIFQRLLVRSLLRFQCVSKSWQSLITDPSFRLHSISAGSYCNFCHCLCGDADDPDDQFCRLKFECFETDDDDDDDDDGDVIDHLRIQLHKFEIYKRLGSSNGLICYADFANDGSNFLVEFPKLFRPSCVHRLYLFEFGESVAVYEAVDEFHRGCLWVSIAKSINDRNSGTLTWIKYVVVDDAKDLLTDKRLPYSLQMRLNYHENTEKPDP
ncbi:LOW QUALITY PROTEIN: hypothetical protein Cgig2_005958 [Carnegiea gigantea]|uniref:F-box domain-containing protein n=1 Tax=Carnegiea gigantea TaxID=171969 RepID=A0A9Q1QK16_9CARY|nr:LOW QUALITY PROTEIN: hypothetical protein Cgig2_005958 [Carnegiea gigantea]